MLECDGGIDLRYADPAVRVCGRAWRESALSRMLRWNGSDVAVPGERRTYSSRRRDVFENPMFFVALRFLLACPSKSQYSGSIAAQLGFSIGVSVEHLFDLDQLRELRPGF